MEPATENVPGLQASHADLFVVFVKLPAAHADGNVLPAAQACPVEQALHSDSDVRFVASEYLPAGHTNAVDAPARQ